MFGGFIILLSTFQEEGKKVRGHIEASSRVVEADFST